MKQILKLIVILFTVGFLSSTINSCKKENEETITVITSEVTEITYHSALTGLEWNGSDENLAEGGICYGNMPEPTLNDNVVRFDLERKETATDLVLLQLIPNTTYHIRAYLKKFTGSSVMTSYGQDVEFTTLKFDKIIKFNPSLTYGSVSDLEGNSYKTIKIGTQVWMAENLRSTRLNDNTPILKAHFPQDWSDSKTPGYNWCEEDSVNYSTTFGAIYNYYAVNTGKLCPVGWHVPSDDEWDTLISFLGGRDVAAPKLIETGSIHWKSPNDGATNESGFTALPGLGGSSEGWRSTTKMNSGDPTMVWSYGIINDFYRIFRNEIYWFSLFNVRCLQD